MVMGICDKYYDTDKPINYIGMRIDAYFIARSMYPQQNYVA